MSCFHCVWDFNSVLSDKDKILNFTLINDLSSNQAHITLFAFLPSALMVPEPREFCFVWMFCARLLSLAAFSHPPPQGWKHCRHGAENGTAQWECQACSRNLRWFTDKPVWVAQMQFMQSFECNEKTTCKKDGGCWRATCPCIWGELGFSMMGIPPLLYHEESVKWSFSFGSCFLMHLFMSSSTLCFCSFLRHILGFISWFIAPVVQSQTCTPSWQGVHSSRAVMTWTIPTLSILSHEMLCFIYFSDSPPGHQPYRRRCLTILLPWGSKWKNLEYLFIWTLSWCF